MAYYEEQLIREIEARVDIVDLIGESVQLTRKGNRYWGLCPFHGEKTPSFCVSRDRQTYYCFGCHKGGNAYSFLMETQGLRFPEAVQLLAEKAGVKLPERGDSRKNHEKEEFLKLHQAAAGYFRQNLKGEAGRAARRYLEQRGVTAESIEKFGLGYAAESWSGLADTLLKQGFSRELLLKSGLVRASEKKKDGFFDLLRNRVIFPIYQYNQSVIAFGGRGLEKEAQPKYLNSPETPIFSKRRNLYGLSFARNAMRDKSEVFLVEGYMDCLKMSQAGITNVVASLGTAFTEEQAALLHRYVEKVILLYDGDEAGQKNTLRAFEILQAEGLRAETLTLPDGMDPDEYVSAYGAQRFYEFWQENRHTVIEFRLERWLKMQGGRGNREAQGQFLRSLKEDFKRLPGEMEKEQHIELLSRRLGVQENLIRRELGAGNRRTAFRRPENRKPPGWNTTKEEYTLIERVTAAMLADEQVFRAVADSVGIGIFKQEQDRTLLQIWQERKTENPAFSMRDLQYEVMQDERLFSRLARLQLIIEMKQEAGRVLVDDFIVRVRKLQEKGRYARLLRKIQQMDEQGTGSDSIRKLLFYVNQVFGADRKGEVK